MPLINNHLKFTDVWNDYEDFKNDYDLNPLKAPIPALREEAAIRTTFYLLYASYGNSEIINRDVHQFKAKIFAVIMKYGAFWDKKLDIQDKIMNLSDAELMKGSTAIFNKAFNPNIEPSTETLDEIPYINEQNTTKYKKSKPEAYMLLWDSLRTSATDDYIRKFRSLFKVFVGQQEIGYYISEEE